MKCTIHCSATSEQRLNDHRIEAQFLKSKANLFGFNISIKQNCNGELKNVESKTPDFPIAIFIDRTDCRLMLLIRRVSQLWLTYALNLVNSIGTANIKHLALNQWCWLLDAAREDNAALAQLIMDRP